MKVGLETYMSDYGIVDHYDVTLDGKSVITLDKEDWGLASQLSDSMAEIIGTEVIKTKYVKRWVLDVS